MSAHTKITFPGSLGENLAARLDTPAAKAYALFAHCFTGSKDLNAVSRISKALNTENIGLFRFDFTGLGGSEGDFANTNFSSNVQDLIAAANYMRDNYEAPKILIGHSLGGTAVLAAAAQIPEVTAIATIGSPFDAAHVEHNFCEEIDTIEAKGQARVILGGREFTLKKQFLDDIKNQNIDEHLKAFKGAILVMHSPEDATVNIREARKIYDGAHHPKSFISLAGADHLLMDNPADGEYVAKVLAAWSSRYLD